jgi:hypothetical protein
LDGSELLLSPSRNWHFQAYRHPEIGFRLVRASR